MLSWFWIRPHVCPWYRGLILGLLVALTLGACSRPAANLPQPSSYAVSAAAPFNQPDHYPLTQPVNPNRYRPVGEWMGRLILPTPAQIQVAKQSHLDQDWVWIELYQAPATAGTQVGNILRLEWAPTPELQTYVQAVTTDVHLDAAAQQAQRAGNVIPSRLQERSQVGPLQSLAGARPQDDLVVRLDQIDLVQSGDGSPVLQTQIEPIQVTGRYYGLVQILGPDPTAPRSAFPATCPGGPPCPLELYQVRHYNPASGQFDGPQETIRIPQQPPDSAGQYISTPRQIEQMPNGAAGWYIYGAPDTTGRFTVQALKPRSLFQLQPDQVLRGERAGRQYLSRQNWQETPQHQGQSQRVWVHPMATQPEAARQFWKVGDRALVVHVFGGIGGERAGGPPATVTGHLSYGVAQVVRDPWTQELQFDLQYQQVYAHNPHGIVAGRLDWSAYGGDLRRGWAGVRPFSDVVIKLDSLTEINLGGIRLFPLQAFLAQTRVMTARYRTGDGTGIAAVTPATSCVQDSSQALYIAIEQLKQQINAKPQVFAWMQAHPQDPNTQKFEQLVALGEDLEAILVPTGVVRSDWQDNAARLAGVTGREQFVRDRTFISTLRSWRSMLPRRAHDEVSRIFLAHGAQLWFLRSNQTLHWEPARAPQAPTVLLGQISILSTVLQRWIDAVAMPLTGRDGWVTAGILVGYGAISLPLGWQWRFLQWQPARLSAQKRLAGIIQSWFMPALVEELIFRVTLLPHPLEGIPWGQWWLWAGISLGAFVLYHPLNARIAYPAGNPTFFRPVFLCLAGLLGVACSLSYGLTGSLWPPVMIHWIVVTGWLFGLGGHQKLS